MNCDQARESINDFIDGAIPERLEGKLRAHIAGCPACEAELMASQRLVTSLMKLPVPAPSTDFETRLFANLPAQTERKHHWFAAGFGTALAASFALWLVVVNPQSDLTATAVPNIQVAVADVTLALAQVQPVRLAINSPHEVHAVTVTLEIPDNLEIEGYPQRRQLQWRTKLATGQNILTLPIIPKAAGESTVVAKVAIGAKTKEFHINVQATDSSVQRRLPDGKIV